MAKNALELLSMMVSEYDKNKRSDFDSMFYLGTPEYVLDQLENLGYISKQEDIIGTIKLTRSGYEAIKK